MSRLTKLRFPFIFVSVLLLAACATVLPSSSVQPVKSPAGVTPKAVQPCPEQTSGAHERTLTLPEGAQIDYTVVLPGAFDCHQAYPILLALPPGGQDKTMVQAGLDAYWAALAEKRGWVVLSPVAPGGRLFFEGSETVLPAFLAQTANEFQPEGGRYHLAGVSNGGISAFRVLVSYPKLFQSLTVAPGYPIKTDADQLAALPPIPVIMYVGAEDTSWLQPMQATQAQLAKLGWPVSLEAVPGDGHIIRHLPLPKLFEQLDALRKPKAHL